MSAPISVLMMDQEHFDAICKIIREHGGVNCSVFTFMNKPDPEILFMGMPIVVREKVKA